MGSIDTPTPAEIARAVTRLESLRTAKDVQRAYAHLLQLGRATEAAELFAPDAEVVWGEKSVRGPDAIRDWLDERSANARRAGGLYTEIIDEPVMHLSPKGTIAYGRWSAMAFTGDGRGAARVEGGVYENEYRLSGGRWLISALRFHPQFDGPYEEGWTNVDGAPLPVVPTHFGPSDAGTPLMAPVGDAPEAADRAEIAARIARLNDEDAVRNLVHAYGYYVDRRMWTDVVDLLVDDAIVRFDAYASDSAPRGRSAARAVFERMGPEGLRYGETNEHPLFDVVVRIEPDARTAVARGIQLGILGDVRSREAFWEFAVLSVRAAKGDDGLWRIAAIECDTLCRAAYAEGWGAGGLAPRAPTVAGVLDAHWRSASPRASGGASVDSDLDRRLRRSLAYDGVENVSGAYGYFLDDFRWADMAAIFARRGHKQSAFAGYAIGHDAILGTAVACYGPTKSARAMVSFHWRTQPVIHVSHDARSANLRTRLFQPRTAIEPDATPKDFYMGGLHSGMYPNDQAVFEDGTWRLWSLAVDEHYYAMQNWRGGWAGVEPRPAGEQPRRSIVLDEYPPEILLSDIEPRETGFRGGPGPLKEWPEILPMWFHYRNPVSGREPELFWPDCVPCEVAPQTRMTAHGFQAPPDGPEVDGVPLASMRREGSE